MTDTAHGVERVFLPSREATYLAFAEAVDAWSEVEWKLTLVFSSLNAPAEFAKSASLLHSIIGTRAQLKAVRAAGRVHLRTQPGLAHRLERLCERTAKTATLRNHVVHGVWRETSYHIDGRYSHTELLRVFSADDPNGPITQSDAERRQQLGTVIFGSTQLEELRDRFRTLAADLLAFNAQLATFNLQQQH